MSFSAKFSPKGGKGNFVAKIIRQKAMVCSLVFPAYENVAEAWYILEINKGKAKEFDQHMKLSIPITLTDYGTILHSGWGKEPPKELKIELNEKYGLYSD